jgi:hypothetical protein
VRSGCWREGLSSMILMRVSSAVVHSGVQVKGWSFLVRVTKGRAMLA